MRGRIGGFDGCTLFDDIFENLEVQLSIGLELDNFRELGVFCDLVLIVGSKRFPCHRIVLASSSPYFHSLLINQFSEYNQTEIELKGLDENGFDIFVQILYKQKVVLHSTDDILSLNSVAHYFDVEIITRKCMDYLYRNLSISSAFKIVSYVMVYRNDTLMDYACNYMKHNFMKIIDYNEFLKIPFQLLRDIISDYSTMVVNEELVFESVYRWINFSRHNRSIYTKQLAACIYAENISDEYLEERNLKHNELTKEMKKLMPLDSKPGFGFRFRRASQIHTFWHCLDAEPVLDIYVQMKVKLYNENISVFADEFETKIMPKKFHRIIVSDNNFYRISYGPDYNYTFAYFNDSLDDWINLSGPEELLTFCVYNMVSIKSTNLIFANIAKRSQMESNNSRVYAYRKDFDQWDIVPVSNCEVLEYIGSSGCLIADDNVFYLCGGLNNQDQVIGSTFRFDPRFGRWEMLKGMRYKRAYAAATFLNDKIYLCGGCSEEYSNYRNGKGCQSTMVYDVRAGKWSRCISLNQEMMDHTLLSHNGKLWAIDGSCKVVEIFEPNKTIWSFGPPSMDIGSNSKIVAAVVF